MAALMLTALAPMLMLALANSIGQDQVCPPNWVQNGSTCYYSADVNVVWADAVELCREQGGALAVIETTEENAFVTAMIHSQSLARGGVWLACIDLKEEGTWVCLAEGNATKPMEFTNWRSGQPNDENGLQDCIKLSITKNCVWSDNNCVEDRFAAVCERDAFPRPTGDPRGVNIKSAGLKCYTVDSTSRPRHI